MEDEIDHGTKIPNDGSRRFHESPARISIRSARAAYFGPGLNLAPHRNAVAVVALALDQPFDLAFLGKSRTAPDYRTSRAALIEPGCLHHLKSRGLMAFVYLDALSDDHAALKRVNLAEIFEAFSGEFTKAWSADRAFAALNLPQRPPPDPRIDAILRAIDDDADAFGTFEAAAAEVGLSPSRCRALVRAAAGVPFRRYRLWRRMACVARCLAEERSLTEAAHSAGFASSAHLSAAFSAMFGVAPSALLKAGVVFDLD